MTDAPRGAPQDDPWGCVERWLPVPDASVLPAGDSRPALFGMRFGVKANLDVAGVPTTAGTRVPREPAAADAAAVAALRRRGAIPVAITTLAEAAVGSVTRNPWTGTCVSPADPTCNAGGSSGGSAAAVAAGIVPVALGSDTMGSVRIPAACCGVLGWKPTHGAVPTTGLVPLASALDTVGVLADDPSVLAAVAVALLGDDSLAAPASPLTRIAVPTLIDGADAAARSAVDAAMDRFGAGTATVDLGVDPAVVRRRGLLLCEVEAAHYWASQVASADRGEESGLSDQLLDLLRFGRDADPARIREAENVLATTRDSAQAVFSDVDLLILPTLPGSPPGVDDDPPGLADLTAWVNLAGLPAVSVPTTVVAEGERVPRSVQLIGAPGSDHRLIEMAARLRGD